MTNLLVQSGTFLTLATVVVLGAVAVFGLWDKKAKERRKDVDGEEDRLIKLLKENVDNLIKKVDQQETDIKKLTKKVQDLEHENTLLVRVLQGRDEETQKFYQQAYEAIKTINNSHEILSSMAQNINATNGLMTELVQMTARHRQEEKVL